MSRASTLILLGILMLLVPFSGLPGAMRTIIAIGLGAAVIGIGVAERSKEQHRLIALQSPHADEPVEREEKPPPTGVSPI